MIETATDLAPVAALMFVAACILWLVWRALRRVFRTAAQPREVHGARVDPDLSRREPVLTPASTAPSTIPDAADVLALKASIDALARQIGALEKRLMPANTNVPVEQASRAARDTERTPATGEVPVVVPDRRI